MMKEEPTTLTIDRDLEDIKAQVKREIDTIRDFCETFTYRNSPPGWNLPFEIHRLRRALRIHYLALKIRGAHVSTSTRELAWNLEGSSDSI